MLIKSDDVTHYKIKDRLAFRSADEEVWEEMAGDPHFAILSDVLFTKPDPASYQEFRASFRPRKGTPYLLTSADVLEWLNSLEEEPEEEIPLEKESRTKTWRDEESRA